MRYGIARFAARGAGARRALLALPLALRIGPQRKFVAYFVRVH
jgi:hypothetical protein